MAEERKDKNTLDKTPPPETADAKGGDAVARHNASALERAKRDGTDLGAPTSTDLRADAVEEAKKSAVRHASEVGTDLDAPTGMDHSGTGESKPSEVPASSSPFVRDADPLVGKQLGPARIEKKLGQGGMGAVYLGTHMTLEKRVAVKVLPGHLAQRGEEYVERFKREAVAAGRLENEHIVQVYDVNEQDGNYYIVMQYVDGADLKALVKEKGPLSLEEATGYVLQVAEGLAAADREGIIHRDIKPENVMLTADGVCKIADFGLAGLQDSDLTRDGQAMGSPYYMSPEQCAGKQLDIRTDIYALGVSFFYLLTGTHPYTGDTPVEIMSKHSGADIPDLSEAQEGIPESVALIVRRMLMKDRDKRYATPEELVEDLRAVLTDPDRVPAGAMKARPPLVSPTAAGILGAAVVIVAVILYVGNMRADAPAPKQPGPPPVAAAPTLTFAIGDVEIPYVEGEGVPSDDWRTPLRIVTVDVDGDNATVAALKMNSSIALALKARDVLAVDRENIESILGEMLVSRTDLVDKNTALAGGRLINAHVMLDGTVAVENGEGVAQVKVIDISTSETVDTLVQELAFDDDGKVTPETYAAIAAAVTDVLDDMPVRGRVSDGGEKEVLLDIGALHGVVEGQTYSVLEEDGPKTVGSVKVTEVEKTSAVAAVEDSDGKLRRGMRVTLEK